MCDGIAILHTAVVPASDYLTQRIQKDGTPVRVVEMARANPVLSTGRPTVGRLLGGGVENAVTSLVPVPLVDFLLGGRLGGDKVLFRLVQFYFNPLAGALTVSLMVALVCAWWMRPSPALGQGFHRLKGPWLALVFGSLIVAALLVARPRYAHAWYGPGPFVWMLGAGLVALGLWTLWRRPTELPPGDARHLEAALFALFGYWGGLLAHPGGEIDGVASNAMVPSVLLVIAYALGRVATLPIRGQGLFLAGVMAEFAAMWALLGNLIAGAMPFVLDTNHALKAQNRLVFIYDLVGGRWVPFALLTLAAQAGALATALLDPARRARRAPGQPVA